MNYTHILQLLSRYRPSLVYVSIGCAAHDDPHSQGQIQQFPPFVRDWTGKKLCILIDPYLEAPPRSTIDIQATQNVLSEGVEGVIWTTSDTIFVPLQKNFYYQNEKFYNTGIPPDHENDIQFMESLCKQTLSFNAKMIVQDYTGRDINAYYPTISHPKLFGSILYDVTYKDGGCFIEFDDIRILRDTDGDFIQPLYSPLSAIYGKIPDSIFQKELTRRCQNLRILHMYACIIRGLAEPRDWLTEEHVSGIANIYGKMYRVSSSDILSILTSAARDVCAASSCSLSTEDIDTIVLGPTHQFMNLFQSLQVLLKISV